ncbi:carbohydrate sulfotransferase 2 isoform X1 [Gadus macrocephalus]|uniref:carbohydrate sulfotransferase 2 isoform X1 n=1 Tax=Gadus macrocephalus TaxID=80720 RepID=UPI0028CB3C75|nr:carbohydrate sulfotransferase 2 isoform X1 [Gadus macrocephalus]
MLWEDACSAGVPLSSAACALIISSPVGASSSPGSRTSSPPERRCVSGDAADRLRRDASVQRDETGRLIFPPTPLCFYRAAVDLPAVRCLGWASGNLGSSVCVCEQRIKYIVFIVGESVRSPWSRGRLPVQMRGKQYNQQLKLTAPWEKDAGYGRKLKTYRNHTKIIAQPGIVMKVLRRKRIVLFMAYFLLLVLTMLNLANYKWTKEPQQCNHQMRSTSYQSRSDIRFLYRPSLAKKRQLVYVLTTWRSGSSFFGELFNQNPHVFFLYEPMWHIWQKLYPGDAVSLQGAARDMLSSLYRCDLSVFQLYNSPGGKNFTSLGLFGATLNKVVCSYPLCSAYRKEAVGMVDDKLCKKCPPQSLRLLEEECLKYGTVVIKGVRILDVNVLAPLMEDPSLDLKVIHLVRDPRAVANSRIKSRHGLIRENLQVVRSRDPKLRRVPFVDPGHKANKKDGSDYHSIGAMEVICDRTSRTLRSALAAPPWLKGRYMAVRYEDLVEDPVKTLRSVYGFANLTANRDIEQFALNMTSGPSSSSKPFIVSSRNATQAASAWRTVLSIQQIKQVEDYCHHAMAVLGYDRVRTAGEAKDLSRSLLSPSKL